MIFAGAGATGRRNRTRLTGRSERSRSDLREEAFGSSPKRFDGHRGHVSHAIGGLSRDRCDGQPGLNPSLARSPEVGRDAGAATAVAAGDDQERLSHGDAHLFLGE